MYFNISLLVELFKKTLQNVFELSTIYRKLSAKLKWLKNQIFFV